MTRPPPSDADRRFMAEALRLARRGLGRTSPNPAVGAVVVAGGRIVGRGWHRCAGGPHAEIFALRQAGRRARGADLYVTLEPCSHFGRTGPCADAVVASGVRRVVVGTLDPNPAVHGRGVAKLRRTGIAVEVGLLEAECRETIAAFAKHVTTGLPWVVLKLAATLDGRIATATGDSRWVSGEAARRRVHEMRNRLDAVLVGSETVLRDDPELTCRIAGGRNPLRVVVDGRLRVSERARVVGRDPETLRLYTRRPMSAKAERLRRRGVTIREGGGDRRGALRTVLRDLGAAGVTSVLVEGGARIAARALREGLVDRLVVFLAPKLVGGDGRPALGPLGVRRIADALALRDVVVETIGDDLVVTATPARPAKRRPRRPRRLPSPASTR